MGQPRQLHSLAKCTALALALLGCAKTTSDTEKSSVTPQELYGIYQIDKITQSDASCDGAGHELSKLAFLRLEQKDELVLATACETLEACRQPGQLEGVQLSPTAPKYLFNKGTTGDLTGKFISVVNDKSECKSGRGLYSKLSSGGFPEIQIVVDAVDVEHVQASAQGCSKAVDEAAKGLACSQRQSVAAHFSEPLR